MLYLIIFSSGKKAYYRNKFFCHLIFVRIFISKLAKNLITEIRFFAISYLSEYSYLSWQKALCNIISLFLYFFKKKTEQGDGKGV